MIETEVLWFNKDGVTAPAGTRLRERNTGIVWEANSDGSWDEVGTYRPGEPEPRLCDGTCDFSEFTDEWILTCGAHGELARREGTTSGHNELVLLWAEHVAKQGGDGVVDQSLLIGDYCGACLHQPERHDSEVGGCIECNCVAYVPKGGRVTFTPSVFPDAPPIRTYPDGSQTYGPYA